jgi:hypothetical protein
VYTGQTPDPSKALAPTFMKISDRTASTAAGDGSRAQTLLPKEEARTSKVFRQPRITKEVHKTKREEARERRQAKSDHETAAQLQQLLWGTTPLKLKEGQSYRLGNTVWENGGRKSEVCNLICSPGVSLALSPLRFPADWCCVYRMRAAAHYYGTTWTCHDHVSRCVCNGQLCCANDIFYAHGVAVKQTMQLVFGRRDWRGLSCFCGEHTAIMLCQRASKLFLYASEYHGTW